MAKVRIEFLRLQYRDVQDGVKEQIHPAVTLEVGDEPTPNELRPVSPGMFDTVHMIWVEQPTLAAWGPNAVASEESGTIILPGTPLAVRANVGDLFSFMLAPSAFFAMNEVGPARDVWIINGVTAAGSTEVAPADSRRKGLTLRNDSMEQMYFRTDGGEASPTSGYPLDAKRGYSFEYRGLLPKGPITVWCGSEGHKWAILYSTDGEAYDA